MATSGTGSPFTTAWGKGFVGNRAAEGIPWAQRFQSWRQGNTNAFNPAHTSGTAHAAAPAPQPGTPAPPPPSPLDSAYWANVNQNQFNVNNKVNGLEEQSAFGANDLQTALSRLAYQEPRDQLKLEEGANNQGGLFSTGYGQQQGDLGVNYSNRAGALNTNFSRQQAARDQQIEGLLGSVPLYNDQQYQAAVARSSQAAAKDPALGESGSPLVPAPKAAPAPAHTSVTHRLAQARLRVPMPIPSGATIPRSRTPTPARYRRR